MTKYDEDTLARLQHRAIELTQARGHLLGRWESAKKKHGVGAKRVICTICGLGLTIMPKHQFKKGHVPAMKGDALFADCTEMTQRH